MSQPSGWEENVRTARKIRDDSLAQTPGGSPQVSAQLLNGLNATVVPEKVLSLDDIKITALDTEQLLSLLASAELSSVTVIEAFMRRAALAQQLVCSFSLFDLLPCSSICILTHWLHLYIGQ